MSSTLELECDNCGLKESVNIEPNVPLIDIGNVGTNVKKTFNRILSGCHSAMLCSKCKDKLLKENKQLEDDIRDLWKSYKNGNNNSSNTTKTFVI